MARRHHCRRGEVREATVILVVFEAALVTMICLVIVPKFVVMLAAAMLECERAELPVARVLPKRQTGRRFQRPVIYSRAS